MENSTSRTVITHAGTYLMRNGRVAVIDRISDGPETATCKGHYSGKPNARGKVKWYYWIWSPDGSFRFTGTSPCDIVAIAPSGVNVSLHSNGEAKNLTIQNHPTH